MRFAPTRILIRAAGFSRDADLAEKMTDAQQEGVRSDSLDAVFLACGAAVSGMPAMGYGRTTSISSRSNVGGTLHLTRGRY
jgi:hypothetical protein